ncbi:MAG: tetratricopeptide repeat protein, partial [Planctomycetes bacterium]|nr:tetratricopeptide repeat protein [Planctomycetota bacterium]
LAPGDEDAALAVATALLRAAELDKQLGESAASTVRERAVQQLQAVAEQFPVSGEALFRLGVLAEAQQDLDGARARFQDALQRDPAHLGALLDLAALCEAAGQHDEATALLQRVVKDASARERLSDDEWRRLVERLQRG